MHGLHVQLINNNVSHLVWVDIKYSEPQQTIEKHHSHALFSYIYHFHFQAVGRLIQQVCSSSTGEGEHDAPLPPLTMSPELSLLWAHCGSGDVVVAGACCEALVSLVRRHRADYSRTLTGLINQAPSAR
jgi:hypothetical protein